MLKPSAAALLGALLVLPSSGLPAGFTETFTTDPAARGWFATGATHLFAWDADTGVLAATWDSREPNSYYARPLGVVLSRTNDFCLVFDLRLAEVIPGINPDRASASFQLAVGLVRLADATSPGFRRGSGFESPNVCDFSYFPDPGGDWQFGPSLTVTIADETGFNWAWDGFAPDGLSTGAVYRVTLTYSAADEQLRATLLQDGAPFLTLPPTRFAAGFADFQLDHVAVCSYSDEGQFPGYEGSLLAHGAVDNVTFLPALPVGRTEATRVGEACAVRFASHVGWLYTLERQVADGWLAVVHNVPGTGGELTLTDPTPPAGMALYRVKATTP